MDSGVGAEWDRRYSERGQMWSGAPNGALVAEVSALPPGRVLDVGCGEGADAIWLAERGWTVTAIEPSGVALARAAEQAGRVGADIAWVHAGLVEAGLPAGSFDLVSAMYPALLRSPTGVAERVLLDTVASGGVLLVVHHVGMDQPHEHRHEAHDDDHAHADDGSEGRDVPADQPQFRHEDFVTVGMIAALLDGDAWDVEVHEERARVIPDGGAGAHHRDDIVLRARRRS